MKEISQSTITILLIVILSGILLGIRLFNSPAYGLILGIILVYIIARRQGYEKRSLLKMMELGIRKASIILGIMILIGMISALWMMSGTIPAMMLLGFRYLSSMNFLLATFLITSGISIVLGTAIGTMSTVGIPLMELGKAMGMPLPLVAGTIISGAYLGDRSSPMSSSANLAANITETKLIDMLKHMLDTLLPAFFITILAYYFIGRPYTLHEAGLYRIQETQQLLTSSFQIGWFSFIPPILIIILAITKVPIVYCMLAGLLSSIVLVFVQQEVSAVFIIKVLVFGYSPDNLELSAILKGGGLLSMRNVILVIASSTALNGLLESLKILDGIMEKYLKGIKRAGGLIFRTVFLSFMMAVMTCNQSLAIIIPGRFMKKEFEKRGISANTLARSIADTGAVVVPLIPWNVNAIATTLILGVGTLNYLPYAFLCYLIPLTTVIYGYLGFIQLENKKKINEKA
ncbi:Na+/H+ antiporter NhaC family protein [Alkaliphilus peptidifermentans]|uniref:Na+:H+ antiporter, NhaC family n=1 Tax=Alkaliphilus peptidifermentans DSM 18978 TaxID=1120976 RepID=A0A1G5J341_9FIRM|nr:Na+/H+ antiporter NhaC family protein [Alkaliphilus peptidifermentans]SCY82765.1 Na+:H+ antiporter, NhaC family [Alkaliphilus peptidifermentans DSM 18978]